MNRFKEALEMRKSNMTIAEIAAYFNIAEKTALSYVCMGKKAAMPKRCPKCGIGVGARGLTEYKGEWLCDRCFVPDYTIGTVTPWSRNMSIFVGG